MKKMKIEDMSQEEINARALELCNNIADDLANSRGWKTKKCKVLEIRKIWQYIFNINKTKEVENHISRCSECRSYVFQNSINIGNVLEKL